MENIYLKYRITPVMKNETGMIDSIDEYFSVSESIH